MESSNGGSYRKFAIVHSRYGPDDNPKKHGQTTTTTMEILKTPKEAILPEQKQLRNKTPDTTTMAVQKLFLDDTKVTVEETKKSHDARKANGN